MRNSKDKLENIKAKHPQLHAQSDTGWLVAEVERLRGQQETLKRAAEEYKTARIADLEALLDHTKRSMQTLDPNSPAYGALRLISHNIKYRLTAVLYGAEGVNKGCMIDFRTSKQPAMPVCTAPQ